VVSNKDGPFVRREVIHLRWEGFFGAVVGAGDAGADKPDPAPIWYALAAIGVRPGPGVWYVGDTALDMRAARAAGCCAVLLGDGSHDGGLADWASRGVFPDLRFVDAHDLATRLRPPSRRNPTFA
jgi:phosphoglycolate phosphatase